MDKPTISLIAVLSENRVIGNKGKIPWHISEDLKRFKKLTQGHAVIMGRKTYESIGKPLPNRINIIITRDKSYKPSEVEKTSIDRLIEAIVCHSLEEAIEIAKKKETAFSRLSRDPASRGEIFIIGGGQIFKETIKFADKLYLTIVKGKFRGDAFFPDYSKFKKIVFKKESRDDNYHYTFVDIEK